MEGLDGFNGIVHSPCGMPGTDGYGVAHRGLHIGVALIGNGRWQLLNEDNQLTQRIAVIDDTVLPAVDGNRVDNALTSNEIVGGANIKGSQILE